jgi:hypothetical protein
MSNHSLPLRYLKNAFPMSWINPSIGQTSVLAQDPFHTPNGLIALIQLFCEANGIGGGTLTGLLPEPIAI